MYFEFMRDVIVEYVDFNVVSIEVVFMRLFIDGFIGGEEKKNEYGF